VIVKGQKLHASVAFLHKDYKTDAQFNGDTFNADGLAGCATAKDNDYQWVRDWNQKDSIPLELDIFDITRVKKHLELLKNSETAAPMASLHQLCFAAQSRMFLYFLCTKQS
jgi:hypothetical protein